MITRTKLKWVALLLLSLPVLVWRLADFAHEAVYESFHITRAGLALHGVQAEVVQLAIILGTLALIWKSVTVLAYRNRS